jgi:hypothetical protein
MSVALALWLDAARGTSVLATETIMKKAAGTSSGPPGSKINGN